MLELLHLLQLGKGLDGLREYVAEDGIGFKGRAYFGVGIYIVLLE